MKGSFVMTVTVTVDGDGEETWLVFEVENVTGGFDLMHDCVENLLSSMSDRLHDELSDRIDEPGNYEIAGEIWVSGQPDDGDDFELHNHTVKRIA